MCYAPNGDDEDQGRAAIGAVDSIGAPPPAPGLAWRVADARILILASVLDDLESARIAAANRLRAFTATLGIDPDLPEVVAMRLLVEETQGVEDRVAAGLAKAMKAHPLGALVERTKGLGLRQAARLLSLIGNPAWHAVHQRPRRLGELRAYCGLHVIQAGDAGGQSTTGTRTTDAPGIAPRRRRGVRSNWSESARKRVWLIAAQGLKLRCKACTAASRAATEADGAGWTPPPPDCTCEADGYVLRRAYDDARAKYREAVHSTPCERCGPAGSPAPVGAPLSAAHQHGRALRLVGKTVLRMLWEEATALCGYADRPVAHAAVSPGADFPTP